MLLTVAGALALAVGPLGCGGDDEPEVDTSELQLVNNTGLAGLEVYVAAEGIAERTYELNQSGATYEDWTKVDYPVTDSLNLQFILYNQDGDELAAGSCKVSDAVELDYARVDFFLDLVSCSCGFVGTTGCQPGNQ